MTITHRIADFADFADFAILIELVKEFHENEHLPFDKQADSIVLEEILTNNSLGQVCLIQQFNEVIGYIIITLGYSLEYGGRDAFIDEFYLRPNYRGQGIGTKTLEFIEGACLALGVKALHLEVDFDNANAQRLYHRVGYKKHERYLMTKWL
ncbi:MAG: GNAT family N-acetyltransferase [Rhizonema sp. PD37]|nr:GNAT family N-acetyltransferase [Rhizonema sp. PD37]